MGWCSTGVTMPCAGAAAAGVGLASAGSGRLVRTEEFLLRECRQMCASGRDCQTSPPFAAAGPLTSDVLRSLDSADRLRPQCNSSLAAVGGSWELSCAGHDPALCAAALALFCSANNADWLWRRRGDRGFCNGAVLPTVEMPCISNLHDRGKLLIRELSDTVSSHDSQGR